MCADAAVIDRSRVTTPGVALPRTIRIGLLGLGNVGQAVARLAPEAQRVTTGIRFRVLSALVRDVDRPRNCPLPPRITSSADTFLRGYYDVVVEALPDVEPARTIIARLLGRGIPVVTANKALVAAHGQQLADTAARRGTILRYEASALAGVPFLGALSERPFVADVTRLVAVVNGTSNFILSTIGGEGCAFDQALARAQELGLAEPDPSRDVDGLDAAAKFALLAAIFGWAGEAELDVETTGIRGLGAADLSAARRFGATIKPVVSATRRGPALEAFVGPALVPFGHPLASLNGTLSGIYLSGRYVSDLFFSGPGAGPEVTAATILDDVVEAVSTVRRSPRRIEKPAECLRLTAPRTEWFVRLRYPGVVPEGAAALSILSDAGLPVVASTDTNESARWIRTGAADRADIERALVKLQHTHRIDAYAIRAL